MIRSAQNSSLNPILSSPLLNADKSLESSPPPQVSDSFEQSSDHLSKQIEQRGQQIHDQTEAELKTPDASTQDKLNSINARLHSEGMPPIDYAQTVQDLQDIENSSSDSKDKKEKIENLRKSLGLSKKEMKRLFTKRMARLYREATKRLETFRDSQLTPMKKALSNSEKVFGAQSPQAMDFKDRLQSLEQNLDSQAKDYQNNGKFLGSLYPGFWARLGNFFKKVGQGLWHALSFIKPLIRFIPGIGTLASVAISGIQKLVDLIHRPKPSAFLN